MGGGRWCNDDTRSEVLRRGKSLSVSVSVIRIRAKLPIRTKLPVRTKFTKKGKITRNL